jgi:hypothetical protein
MSTCNNCGLILCNNAFYTSFVDDNIDSITTVEEFKKIAATYLNYPLDNATRLAASHGNVKLLDYIISIAERRFLDIGNYRGYTALHLAAAQSQFECVKKLIVVGANINLATLVGGHYGATHCTPLYLAAYHEASIKVVKLLVLNGGILRAKKSNCSQGKPFIEADIEAKISRAKKELFEGKKALLLKLGCIDINSTFYSAPLELIDKINTIGFTLQIKEEGLL